MILTFDVFDKTCEEEKFEVEYHSCPKQIQNTKYSNMFRAAASRLCFSNRLCNTASLLNTAESELNVQSVREMRIGRTRKPYELGTSKSKLFRLIERPKPHPEVARDQLRLRANY